MADTAVTNTDLTLEEIKELSLTDATVDEADATETFAIKPTRRNEQTCIVLQCTDASSPGDVAISIAPGDFWASGVALEVTLLEGKTMLLFVETGKYLDEDGYIKLTATPASGKKLLTDHALKVGFIQLP